MSQNRRFTRSATSGLKNNNQRDLKNKEEAQLRLKVKEAIAENHFDQALALIKSESSQNHWVVCTRAQILFQRGSIQRAISAIRNALKIQSKDCYECFQLLLKLIERTRPQTQKFRSDIESCLNSQRLPKKMKSQFENLLSQLLQNKQISLSTNRQFQELTAYYQNKGLLFKKVQIVEVDMQYRVARAKSAIRPHQIIIFVPEKQMITLEMAKTLPQVGKLAEEQSHLKSPKHCMLSVFLLIHLTRGTNSPYFNYIQCLPRKLQNFPIYYSDELMQQLEGTYFLNVLRRKKADIEQDYHEILSIVPTLKSVVNFQKFVWARMVVSSRIFGVMINGKKTDALVPIADMLNHKTPKMTSWYFSDEKRGFVVQNANQQIPKGQQIFDSYGSKCNSRFLLNYGFTMPQNSFNEVMIMLKKHKNSKIIPPNIKLSTCLNSDQFRVILAYYRQSISQLNNLQAIDQDQLRTRVVNFISNQNQCEVWKMIQHTMRDQIQQYKTSVKIDEKILRSNKPLQFNYRNCVEIRLGEKKILQFYLKMSKKMIEHFARRRKQHTDLSEYQVYMREILNQSSINS